MPFESEYSTASSAVVGAGSISAAPASRESIRAPLPGLAQGQSRPAEVASGPESVERILSSHWVAAPVAISTMRFAHWFRSRGRFGCLLNWCFAKSQGALRQTYLRLCGLRVLSQN